MWAVTHSYVCHDSFIYVPWLIQIYAMTHSYVCRDSFTCVPWLSVQHILMTHAMIYIFLYVYLSYLFLHTFLNSFSISLFHILLHTSFSQISLYFFLTSYSKYLSHIFLHKYSWCLSLYTFLIYFSIYLSHTFLYTSFSYISPYIFLISFFTHILLYTSFSSKKDILGNIWVKKDTKKMDRERSFSYLSPLYIVLYPSFSYLSLLICFPIYLSHIVPYISFSYIFLYDFLRSFPVHLSNILFYISDSRHANLGSLIHMCDIINRVAKTHRIPYLYRSLLRKSDLYLVALLWKMIYNLGDPMSLHHPVLCVPWYI